MPVRRVVAPELEPVTLFQAKEQLRLESDADNDYVDGLITTAREHIERVCWRGLVTQTWELVLPAFPEDGTPLPMGNLASITSIKYIDTAGVEQTLAGSEYEADTDSVPGTLRLAYGAEWPEARDQWDAVRIRYVVGWAVASVPKPLFHAIMLIVSQLYEHRTPEVTGTIIAKVQLSLDALLAPFELRSFDGP